MKIMNILLICVVVIVGNLLFFNKKAISQDSVDGGNIVMMNIQNGELTLVYHKPSRTFLFYGYPAGKSSNDGMQLLQIRSLSNDFTLATKLSKLEEELEWNDNGYTVKDIKKEYK